MENFKLFSCLGILSKNVLQISHPTVVGLSECIVGLQNSGKAIAINMESHFE